MDIPPAVERHLSRWGFVSRETFADLLHLVGQVERWSRTINLVADPRPDAIWERHLLDSAQLFPLRHPLGTKWCDLGTGGGFPGLVIAILAREADPALSVTLVESDRRKAAFLSQMVRELKLNAIVRPERAQSLTPEAADTVSARALSPLPELLSLVHRHLAPGGVALLPKGRSQAEEIARAKQRWAFTVDPIESIVSAQSRILRVSNLQRFDAP